MRHTAVWETWHLSIVAKHQTCLLGNQMTTFRANMDHGSYTMVSLASKPQCDLTPLRFQPLNVDSQAVQLLPTANGSPTAGSPSLMIIGRWLWANCGILSLTHHLLHLPCWSCLQPVFQWSMVTTCNNCQPFLLVVTSGFWKRSATWVQRPQ